MWEGKQNSMRRDDRGDMGVGTLIIFIAMVLMAAVAATVIINTASILREQAEETGRQSIDNVATSMTLLSSRGDRNLDGTDTSEAAAFVTQADTFPPSSGTILTVVNADAEDPGNAWPEANYVNWSLATDLESGIAKHEIHRSTIATEVDELSDLSALTLIDTLNGTDESWVDFNLTAGSGNDYYYALVAEDLAGNRYYYPRTQFFATEDGNSANNDDDTTGLTVPGAVAATITADTMGIVLHLDGTQSDQIMGVDNDKASGIYYLRVYRALSPITSSDVANVSTLVRTYTPHTTPAVDVVSDITDYPPFPGTWYYAVIIEDRAGNTAFTDLPNANVGTISNADSADPIGPSNLDAVAIPYGISLSWNSGSDPQGSGIEGYAVYRSTGSVQNIESLVPLNDANGDGILHPDEYIAATTLSYRDYDVAAGSTYYYVVAAIDYAKNLGANAPRAKIQVLELEVGLASGSPAVDFDWPVIIEISDGTKNINMVYDSSVTSNFASGAGPTTFTVEKIRDTEGTWDGGHVLSPGGVLKIYISTDIDGTNLNLYPQDMATLRIIPKHGIPLLAKVYTPSAFTSRFVELS